MPLVLGFKKDEDFYVADTQVRVIDIVSDSRVMVEAQGKEFMLRDDMGTKVADNIKLSVGNSGDMETARILIDAPRSMNIVRGRLKRSSRYEKPDHNGHGPNLSKEV